MLYHNNINNNKRLSQQNNKKTKSNIKTNVTNSYHIFIWNEEYKHDIVLSSIKTSNTVKKWSEYFLDSFHNFKLNVYQSQHIVLYCHCHTFLNLHLLKHHTNTHSLLQGLKFCTCYLIFLSQWFLWFPSAKQSTEYKGDTHL